MTQPSKLRIFYPDSQIAALQILLNIVTLLDFLKHDFRS